MDITLDAAALSPMLGRLDVFQALLAALKEDHGDREGAEVLKLRLRRALQGSDLTVRLANARARVPAEQAFLARTIGEVHPSPRLVALA